MDSGNSSDRIKEDIQLLQDLVVDNPELERLESLLDEFNIFEALGAVHQELRHSDFLAFLLNPNQNHNLGDTFVKRLLQKVATESGRPLPITAIDLDLWDLDNIEVRREWQSIDILLLDDMHEFAIIIENKIDTGEHDDQLRRYRSIVEHHYPTYKIVGLYLTPDGSLPSDDTYYPLGYSLVCTILEGLIESRSSILGQEVLTLLRSYVLMLRRHIVGESEIEQLCRKIYRRHQRALDMIFEYRPDQQSAIYDYLCGIIRSHPEFELDHHSKSAIKFIPKHWDTPVLKIGKGWTQSGRMLLLEFNNQPQQLKLSIMVGNGPEEVRRQLWQWISQNEPPFKRAYRDLGKNANTVYVKTILPKNAYIEKSTEELQDEITHRWIEFLEHDLPRFDAIMKSAEWLKIG